MTFAVVELEAVETVAQPGGVGWKPVRERLGISAFGINVWTSDAGDEVIGAHVETDEQAGGHEEAYLVLSGGATFTIGVDEVEARQNTVVAIHDPAVRRSAVATEDGTVVLAVGGRIAEPFQVGAWEFIARSGALAREGDLAGAIGALERGLELHAQNATLLYHLACYESLSGHTDRALAHLEASLRRRGDLRRLAAREPDFERLRSQPAFERLLGG